MFNSGFALVLAVFLHVTLANLFRQYDKNRGPTLIAHLKEPQTLPKKCTMSYIERLNPEECCDINIFSIEDMMRCGLDGSPPDKDPAIHKDCTKAICLLKRVALLTSENKLNYTAISEFFDFRMVETPENANAYAAAKTQCTQERLPGPAHLCDQQKFVNCIPSVCINECPKFQVSNGCKLVQKLLQECMKIYQQYTF